MASISGISFSDRFFTREMPVRGAGDSLRCSLSYAYSLKECNNPVRAYEELSKIDSVESLSPRAQFDYHFALLWSILNYDKEIMLVPEAEASKADPLLLSYAKPRPSAWPALKACRKLLHAADPGKVPSFKQMDIAHTVHLWLQDDDEPSLSNTLWQECSELKEDAGSHAFRRSVEELQLLLGTYGSDETATETELSTLLQNWSFLSDMRTGSFQYPLFELKVCVLGIEAHLSTTSQERLSAILEELDKHTRGDWPIDLIIRVLYLRARIYNDQDETAKGLENYERLLDLKQIVPSPENRRLGISKPAIVGERRELLLQMIICLQETLILDSGEEQLELFSSLKEHGNALMALTTGKSGIALIRLTQGLNIIHDALGASSIGEFIAVRVIVNAMT